MIHKKLFADSKIKNIGRINCNHKKYPLKEIGVDFKQKKSPFLMTFLFAPFSTKDATTMR